MTDNDNTIPDLTSQTTMSSFSLAKFIGVKDSTGYGVGTPWYEIAHNVASMKDKCHKAQVVFGRIQNSKVKGGVQYNVTNTCIEQNSRPTSITGTITIDNLNDTSKMKVKFGTLSFASNYWVFDTDYDNYAIVSNGTDKFWILSRKDKIPVCEFNKYLIRVKEIGFETRLIVLDDGVLVPCGGDDTKNK